MVTKNTFRKKFPDVKVQRLETKVVFSKREIEKTVVDMCNMCGFGLLYFEAAGKKITVYTSDKMKEELSKMTDGAELTEPNTGQHVQVISREPFLVGGEYCIRVQFPNGYNHIYSCEFLID